MDESPIVQNQLCSVKNPKEEEVADDGSGSLVCPYAAHALRLSTATVCLLLSSICLACLIYGFICTHIFGVPRSIPPLWPLLIAYLFWILYIDGSADHGGRSSPWFRSMRFWRYFADYYPAS
jgi:hypothetical protein